MDRLIDAYADGLVDRNEFESRIVRSRSRAAKLREQLAALEIETREQTVLRQATPVLLAKLLPLELVSGQEQAQRHIRRRSDCYRLERPVAGREFHPLEINTFSRRTVF